MFTCVKAFIKGIDPSSIMTLGHQQITTKNFDSYFLKHFFAILHAISCSWTNMCILFFTFFKFSSSFSFSTSNCFTMINNLYSRMWSKLYKFTCIPFFTRLPLSLLLFLLSVCFLEFTTISFWIGLIMKFKSIQRWYKSSHKKNMKHFLNAPFHYHPTKIKILNNSFSWTLDSIFNDNVF